MSLSHKKILGVNITFSQKDIILEEIEKYLSINKKQTTKNKKNIIKPFVIYTPNPEIINYAQKDETFKEIVNTAQINLPDGNGVVWAVKKIYGKIISKISGSDFVWDLVKITAKKGFTIGLIGGRNGVALDVRECLLSKYPEQRVEVLGEPNVEIRNSKFEIRNLNPEFGNEKTYWNDLISKIRIKNISILLVAMGHPKQEFFIENVKCQMSCVNYNKPLVLMTVGGTFGYISGRIPRAPLLMRNLGLEWLFRLIREPQRLGRQIRGGEFFLRILRESTEVGS